MFRATMCPSSGENIVPMRHLVFSPDDEHSCPKHVEKSNKH